MEEKIQCSAIWVDNGNIYPNQPLNITNGFVVCGLRHNNCFGTLSIISNTCLERVAILNMAVQGFLTSSNRFVDRKEGYSIAFESGQLANRVIQTRGNLHSEDLW